MDENETDDPSLVGEFCHIVAESEHGPRGASTLTSEERNRSSNLIVLCRVHHKVVDDQINTYTVERLHEIKGSHEAFVAATFNNDEQQHQREEELLAGYVDKWVEMTGLDRWQAWTSHMLGGQPTMHPDIYETLNALPEWLLSRIWPRSRFLTLQKALLNFRIVLRALLNTFQLHSEALRDEHGAIYIYSTKKIYQIEEWNPELNSRLLREYECHVALVEDYICELTRAANYVCDSVRLELLAGFRLEEGALLITSGMDMNLRFTTFLTEYRELDLQNVIESQQTFNKARLTRDVHFGTEEQAAYLENLARLRRFPPE